MLINLRLPFENASFQCQNGFEKCTTKTELCDGKSYIEKLYTRLQLQMPLHVSAQLSIVTQPCFQQEPLYVKLTTFFLAKTIEHQAKRTLDSESRFKIKVTLDNFRKFANISSHSHLKSFAWKRYCPISSKLQTSQS